MSRSFRAHETRPIRVDASLIVILLYPLQLYTALVIKIIAILYFFKDIAKVDIEECTAYSGSKCEHKCTNDHDMICGDDGRTYLNRCYLQVEHCE